MANMQLCNKTTKDGVTWAILGDLDTSDEFLNYDNEHPIDYYIRLFSGKDDTNLNVNMSSLSDEKIASFSKTNWFHCLFHTLYFYDLDPMDNWYPEDVTPSAANAIAKGSDGLEGNWIPFISTPEGMAPDPFFGGTDPKFDGTYSHFKIISLTKTRNQKSFYVLGVLALSTSGTGEPEKIVSFNMGWDHGSLGKCKFNLDTMYIDPIGGSGDGTVEDYFSTVGSSVHKEISELERDNGVVISADDDLDTTLVIPANSKITVKVRGEVIKAGTYTLKYVVENGSGQAVNNYLIDRISYAAGDKFTKELTFDTLDPSGPYASVVGPFYVYLDLTASTAGAGSFKNVIVTTDWQKSSYADPVFNQGYNKNGNIMAKQQRKVSLSTSAYSAVGLTQDGDIFASGKEIPADADKIYGIISYKVSPGTTVQPAIYAATDVSNSSNRQLVATLPSVTNSGATDMDVTQQYSFNNSSVTVSKPYGVWLMANSSAGTGTIKSVTNILSYTNAAVASIDYLPTINLTASDTQTNAVLTAKEISIKKTDTVKIPGIPGDITSMRLVMMGQRQNALSSSIQVQLRYLNSSGTAVKTSTGYYYGSGKGWKSLTFTDFLPGGEAGETYTLEIYPGSTLYVDNLAVLAAWIVPPAEELDEDALWAGLRDTSVPFPSAMAVQVDRDAEHPYMADPGGSIKGSMEFPGEGAEFKTLNQTSILLTTGESYYGMTAIQAALGGAGQIVPTGVKISIAIKINVVSKKDSFGDPVCPYFDFDIDMLNLSSGSQLSLFEIPHRMESASDPGTSTYVGFWNNDGNVWKAGSYRLWDVILYGSVPDSGNSWYVKNIAWEIKWGNQADAS